MTDAVAEGTVETEAPQTTTIGKKKVEKTGNLILDIAHEVESMSKTKALNEAEKAAENIEVSYFRLGGLLKLINDNSWYEGKDSFDDFVLEHYGFAGRKARYLIQIYDNLVTKMIPWEKVQSLGWTKLKDLAPILTPENVDEWVLKATPLTVVELQALLKAQTPSDEGDKTVNTTDDIVKMSFKFKNDQIETVQQAIAKAKGELNTNHDTVALENICSGYLGGNTGVHQTPSIVDLVNQLGFEPALIEIAAAFPMYDINVAPATK